MTISSRRQQSSLVCHTYQGGRHLTPAAQLFSGPKRY